MGAFFSGILVKIIEWLGEKIFGYFKAQAAAKQAAEQEAAQTAAEAAKLQHATTPQEIEDAAKETLDHL